MGSTVTIKYTKNIAQHLMLSKWALSLLISLCVGGEGGGRKRSRNDYKPSKCVAVYCCSDVCGAAIGEADTAE